MKRVQKLNLGSANTSHQRRTCKKNSGSSKDSIQRMENISNYFFKTTDQKPRESDTVLDKSPDVKIESPYKNLSESIRPIINTSIVEENDFKTPKPIKRIPKIFHVKTLSNKQSKTSKSKPKSKWTRSKSSEKQTVTAKMIEDNFKNNDVNAEQLQMALALSNSIQDNKHLEEQDDLMMLYPSTQQKLTDIKQTLQQFGFKPSKLKVDIEKISSEKLPKQKKSKYQYVTPILFIRTKEDRENLISSKISLILSNTKEVSNTSNKAEDDLFSKYLKNLHCRHADMFKRSHLDSEHENFYVKNFNLSPCKSRCGHLLKRWEDIPGRDATPPRALKTMKKTCNELKDPQCGNNVRIASNIETTCTSPNKVKNKCNQFSVGNSDVGKHEMIKLELKVPCTSVQRSLSPDLFSSDEDDYQITKINKSIDDKLESSFEIIDNIKRTHLKDNKIRVNALNSECCFDNASVVSYGGCNLSSENVISKSVLSISTTMHENVILRKNVDVYSASMLSNFESTGNDSVLRSTQFSHSDKCEQDNLRELYNLTQSSDSTDTPIRCIYTNDTSDHATKFIKNDVDFEERQTKILSQTIRSVPSSSQNINDKFLSDDSDTLLDLTQSSDGSYANETSEVNTDLVVTGNDSDQIDKCNLNLGENENCGVENDISLNLNCIKSVSQINNKYEFCELSHSDIGNICLNNSTNKMIEIDVTETYNTNKYELNDTDLSLKNVTKIIEVISDPETEMEQTSSNWHNEIGKIHDLKGICENECREQNNQICNYTFQTLSSAKYLDKTKVNKEFTKHDSFKSVTSECSQESIYISDEELNYSSVYSTPFIKESTNAENVYKRTSYEFSDDSATDEITAKGKYFEDERNDDGEKSNNVIVSDQTTIFKNITGEEQGMKNDTMDFVDELLNSRNQKYFKLNKMEKIPHIVENKSVVRNHINVDLNEYFDDHSMNHDYTICNNNQHSIHQYHTVKDLNKCALPNTNHDIRKDAFHKLLNKSNVLLQVEKPNPTISKEYTYLNICKNDEIPTIPKNETYIQNYVTPDGALFIKTDNVTPVPFYESMNTPKIATELEKFGVKNLKRKRGVQILKHIYESTHPTIGLKNEDVNRIIKRRSSSTNNSCQNLKSNRSSHDKLTPMDVHDLGNTSVNNYDIYNSFVKDDGHIEIIGDLLSQNISVEDLIFEKKQSVKVASCRIPLHIVWHNLTSSQPKLKESILLYEPLQLEVLYAMLKENGFKFDIKDLLTFLDKKCITVRTNQHQRQVRKKNAI